MSDTTAIIPIPPAALVRRLDSPAYPMRPPELWNGSSMPPDPAGGLELMQGCWQTPVIAAAEGGVSVLEDVFVCAEGLVFDRDLALYEPTRQQHSDADIQAAAAILRDTAAAMRPEPITAVLCKKTGGAVFGHWLIELLPVAWYARATGIPQLVYLIPPAHGAMLATMHASLTLLGIPSDRMRITGAEPRRVARLVVVHGLTAHGGYMSPLVLEAMRALQALIAPAGAEGLYVQRVGPHGRRLRDEPALRTQLAARGFASFDPVVTPFARQVARFSAARRIVGVMGSAMANMVFSPPGCTVYNLAPAAMPDTFFWFIAGLCGHRYVEIRCPPAHGPARLLEWDDEMALRGEDRDRILAGE